MRKSKKGREEKRGGEKEEKKREKETVLVETGGEQREMASITGEEGWRY